MVCYSQDNLVRTNHFKKYEITSKYRTELNRILFKNVSTKPIIRTIVFSSPEVSISIEKEQNGKVFLIERKLGESLWSYEAEEMTGPPIMVPDEDSDSSDGSNDIIIKEYDSKADYKPVNKQEIQKKKNSIIVITSKIMIDEQLAKDLQSIWKHFITKAIIKSNYYGGIDGRTYLFQFSDTRGTIHSAEIWSPTEKTKTWYLVNLVELLSDFTKVEEQVKTKKQLEINSIIEKIKSFK